MHVPSGRRSLKKSNETCFSTRYLCQVNRLWHPRLKELAPCHPVLIPNAIPSLPSGPRSFREALHPSPLSELSHTHFSLCLCLRMAQRLTRWYPHIWRTSSLLAPLQTSSTQQIIRFPLSVYPWADGGGRNRSTLLPKVSLMSLFLKKIWHLI